MSPFWTWSWFLLLWNTELDVTMLPCIDGLATSSDIELHSTLMVSIQGVVKSKAGTGTHHKIYAVRLEVGVGLSIESVSALLLFSR